jgi:hypothetical protein
LQTNQIAAMGLSNDNFYGYLDAWIWENNITWMEKTVATPFWTGMLLFSIDSRGEHRRKTHNLLDEAFQPKGRVFFKGQLFSAPMNWADLLEQLQKLETNATHISLPVIGEVLAARVRISIVAGLIDLNNLLRQATIRRNVVIQLIRMRRDMGHPDYARVDMRAVEQRARQLAPSDDPVIPSGLVAFLHEATGCEDEMCSGVDKAATPAERVHDQEDLCRELDRIRPQTLVAQRDSDANRDVAASRDSAFAQYSVLKLQIGSSLADQFHSSYILRDFCTSLPWWVGGPDFPRQKRWRRRFDDAPSVSLDMYTAMMAARCEYQIRADWDLNPGLFSRSFASKVNLGLSLTLKRALRCGRASDEKR